MTPEAHDLYVRGIRHYENGFFSEAENIFMRLLAVNPGFADIHNKLGLILHQRGDSSGAISHFESAVTINPAYTEAALNLAVVLSETGNAERAGDVMRRSAQASSGGRASGSVDAYTAKKLANEHFRLGCIYIGMGMNAEAIDEFVKAEKFSPHFVDILVKHGIALRNAGRIEEALAKIRSARDINPWYEPAWIQLGITLYSSGSPADAVCELEEAVRLMPDLKDARSYLEMLKQEAY